MTSPVLLLNRLREQNWLERLTRPTDAAWLGAFRIILGVLLAISMGRFLAYGWIDQLLVQPTFHFKYWGFEWVQPLPGPWMHALFWLLLLTSLCVAAGFAFRLSALVLALGLSYVQLIDVSTYLNHYYLAALLVWLLSVSPAAQLWSVDAWYARRGAQSSDTPRIAAGWLYLFRFQIGIVYTFAGLAKAQSDWLVHGQPLGIWLGASTDLPILGPLFTLEGVPLVMSWCGFLFDTTIVAWLLIRKTRPWAFVVLAVFHLLTGLLLPIGMFPFIMTSAALMFFGPDWPRRIARRLKSSRSTRPIASMPAPRTPQGPPSWRPKLGIALGVAYCALQLALPLRYLAYGGNVLWHEQGMRFSWRVMVRAKGGNTTFIVQNKQTGKVWHLSPRSYLTTFQAMEMSGQPDLILQLAHHIQRDLERRGHGPVEVRADARVAFNGRRSARLVDPARDLTTVRDGLLARDWVLPAPDGPPPRTRPVL